MAKYIGRRLFSDITANGAPFNTIEDMFDFMAKLPDPAAFVNKNLRAPSELGFERGAWVNTISDEHRTHNNGAIMFDGNKFINLNYEYCNHGAPPLTVVDEFSIHYWAKFTCSNVVIANLTRAKILSVNMKIVGKYTTTSIYLSLGDVYQLIIISNCGFNTSKLFGGPHMFLTQCDKYYAHEFEYDQLRTLFHIDDRR